MAEASKIRLVRCPKCGNVLPELPGYSVYACGGCDAVLIAKKKAFASEILWEKSNKEKNVESDANLATVSQKVSGSLGSLSETDKECDGIELKLGRRKDKVLAEGNVNLVSVSSSSRMKDIEVLIDNEEIDSREDHEGLRLDNSNSGIEIETAGERSQSPKYPINVLVGGDDQDFNLNRSNSVHSSVVKGVEEVSAKSKNSAEIINSRVVVDQASVQKVGALGVDEDPGEVLVQSKYFTDEGPSNHKPNSAYRYGEPMKNFGYQDRPKIVESLKLNRPGILRKLDELKEQISRLEDKPREAVLDDKRMTPPESSRKRAAHNVSTQSFTRGNHVPNLPNFRHNCGPATFMNDRNFDLHNVYPPLRHAPTMIPGSNYENPFQSQMLRRPPDQTSLLYPQQLPPDYISGRYMNNNHDLHLSHSQEPYFHQPACSCVHYCNKNRQAPPKAPGSSFSNRRVVKDQRRSNSYHHIRSVAHGPRNYDPLGGNPLSLHSQDPQSHTRWPVDNDADVEDFYQSLPKRVVAAHGNIRLSHPIAGGAPFLTCCNCLELLKLPRKVMIMAKNMQKIKCGNCATIYSIEIKNKSLIVSVATKTEWISRKADDGSFGLVNRNIVDSNVGGMNSCSIDFDNSGSNFYFADTKQNLQLEGPMLKLGESENLQCCSSSPLVSTEDPKSRDSVVAYRDASNSSDLPSKDGISPTIVGSSFNEHLDESCSICAVRNSGKGNRSKRLDEEKDILKDVSCQHSGEKDASMETEVEVSFNEYLSHDSEVSREEEKPRNRKGQKAFLVGLIKKSFRDFSRSNQNRVNARPNVSVNGRCIPNRLVKKAEKLAGPIEPGDYCHLSKNSIIACQKIVLLETRVYM
ncbi:protein ENHANCED DISEASE RESISTANCE 4-like isoform X2 [Mangifera indica]|uniref:protein ENHANCED DISEASE RESISTANCE 4-like isoform X2 n=1 Tax=Mangifera indica TaxID=29780 RepID=UPI001CFA7364|nr:protein ENHANCED DISEASE RESISTANCE 4-like isoform X2 [Mangifera indica]